MVKPALELQLPGGVPMTFQRVPTEGDPKPFRMGERNLYWAGGSSDPVVQVRLAEPFYLGTCPVTQAQFAQWTRAEKIEHENHFAGHSEHPAENLDWRQALGYCAWLTQVAAGQMPEGLMACLPTEAEWEYACRAGTETEYYTGDGETALAEAGWFGEEGDSGSTHPVRQKAPNAFGLYDLHGNVWEWCHDAWDAAAYRSRLDGAPDPGWQQRLDDWQRGLKHLTKSDTTRVLRGGSWFSSAGDCRSAYRLRLGPVFRFWILGFRVCLVRGPAGQRGARQQTARAAGPAPGDGGRGTRPESDGAGLAAMGRTIQTLAPTPRHSSPSSSRRDGAIIAQRFNAGRYGKAAASPGGTTARCLSASASSVPPGLGGARRILPSVQTLGYFQTVPPGLLDGDRAKGLGLAKPSRAAGRKNL